MTPPGFHRTASASFLRTEGLTRSLYRVPSLGGLPRRLVEDAGSGDFSPDGQSLAFVRWLKAENPG